MNLNGNHNPNVVVGKYDPNRQAKTELNDYAQYLFPGYVDPTQVPMSPGDTQVPVRTEPINRTPVLHSEQAQTYNVQATPSEQSIPKAISSGGRAIASSNQSIAPIRIPIVIELTINLNINH